MDRKQLAIVRLDIVDDDPAVSDALAPLFETAGFEVHTFVNDVLRVSEAH